MPAARLKARADPRKLDRRADEGAAFAVALGVVIGDPVAVLITEGLVGPAAVDELGGQDGAVAVFPAVHPLFVIDHAELVAGTEFAGKVDIPAEDMGQVADLGVAQAGLLAVHEQ